MTESEELRAVSQQVPEELAAIREVLARYPQLGRDARAILRLGLGLGLEIGKRLAEKAKA